MGMTALAVLDDVVRSILVLATAASFFPQARRIISLRNSAGVSTVYLLLIAISAMEQFTLYTAEFLWRDENDHRDGSGVLKDRTVGEWLDLAQVAVFVAGSVLLFFHAAFHPPFRPLESLPTVFLLVMFAFISLLPAFTFFSLLRHHPYPPHVGLDRDIFFGMHGVFVNPASALLMFPGGLFVQWLVMHQRETPRALSEFGLKAQAIVGLLVGVSWAWRVPGGEEDDWSPGYAFGVRIWLLVHYLLWAALQGALAGYVKFRGWSRRVEDVAAAEADEEAGGEAGESDGSQPGTPGERTPLLLSQS